MVGVAAVVIPGAEVVVVEVQDSVPAENAFAEVAGLSFPTSQDIHAIR